MIMVNLGCGTTTVAGWHNYDNSPNAWLSKVPFARWVLWRIGLLSDFHYNVNWDREIRVRELTKRLPYRDGTVDVVFTSHFLEHVDRKAFFRVLAEIYRILKPDTGLVRVVMPNLDYYVNMYQKAKLHAPASAADRFIEELRVISTARDPHLWMYDVTSLVAKLESVGFSEVKERSFRDGACPDLEVLDNRPEDSMWVEARKLSRLTG